MTLWWLCDKLKAAQKGDAKAQCTLGLMYYIGEGVDADDKEALSWFRKAADQGNAEAQFHVGCMYANGTGVRKNLKAAVPWFCKAADQGNARAHFNLGVIHAKGEVVVQNNQQSCVHLLIAIALGSGAKALEYAEEIRNDLSKAEYVAAKKKAARLLKKFPPA